MINLFRLGSTNPKKKSQTLDAVWWGAKLPTKKKDILNFFFQKCSNIFNQIFFSPFFFSKVFKFTWKIRNRLNRKKNHIPDFSDLYFSSYSHFCTSVFDTFFTITRKIKIGDFFYYFFQNWSKLRGWEGGGLHILSWRKAQSWVQKRPYLKN